MDKRKTGNQTQSVQNVIEPAAIVEPAQVAEISVGSQLKQAREAKGLTPEHIASQMHLAPATIVNIEHDIFTDISETFAKGYLRGYAKLVGLNPDELVAQYSIAHEPEKHNPFYRSSIDRRSTSTTNNPLKGFTMPSWLSFKMFNLRYITYAVVGIIIVVMVSSWMHHHSSNKAVVATPTTAITTSGTETSPTVSTTSTEEAQKTTPTVTPAEAAPHQVAPTVAAPVTTSPKNEEVTNKLTMDN